MIDTKLLFAEIYASEQGSRPHIHCFLWAEEPKLEVKVTIETLRLKNFIFIPTYVC